MSGQLEVGSVVVLCCASPKEKVWGCLVRLDATGIVIRGLALGSVEDFLAQERGGEPPLIAPSTLFVPMHRVERMYCDETTAALVSYADRYRQATGRDVRDALLRPLDEPDRVQ